MQQRVRRTQAERVEETRARLLEATIDSLAAVGYAATTTREVAELAGVSRGAQTHHYPTKSELVSAAIEYLFAQQAERFRAAVTAIPVERRDLGSAVELLWEIVQGRTYAAVLEVTVAARTDDSLRVVVHAVAATFERTVVDLLLDVFPALDGDERVARALLDLALSLTQGAAISTYAGFGDPARTIRLMRNVATLINATTLDLVRGAIDALDHDR